MDILPMLPQLLVSTLKLETGPRSIWIRRLCDNTHAALVLVEFRTDIEDNEDEAYWQMLLIDGRIVFLLRQQEPPLVLSQTGYLVPKEQPCRCSGNMVAALSAFARLMVTCQTTYNRSIICTGREICLIQHDLFVKAHVSCDNEDMCPPH